MIVYKITVTLFISKYTNEPIFQPLVPPPWQLLGANTATTGKKLVLLKSPELNIAFVLIQNCEVVTFQVLASSGSLLILLYSDTNYALEVQLLMF